MTKLHTEEETLAHIAELTRTRLETYVAARVVEPVQTDAGLRFRPVDIARLELLCELETHFALEPEALDLVMSLIDELHAAHADLAALMDALAEEPPELRARLAGAVVARRTGTPETG
jgi:chaperone modulatory protein CbpM